MAIFQSNQISQEVLRKILVQANQQAEENFDGTKRIKPKELRKIIAFIRYKPSNIRCIDKHGQKIIINSLAHNHLIKLHGHKSIILLK